MTWNEKQKIAFIRIQDEVLSECNISNLEVAEMFSMPNKETVFSVFQFQTGHWMAEFDPEYKY